MLKVKFNYYCFISLVMFLLLMATSCTSNDSNNNTDQKDSKNKQASLELATKHNAIDLDARFSNTIPRTIDIQQFVEGNHSSVLLSDIYLDDVYKKDGKIYAAFSNISIWDASVIAEIDAINLSKIQNDYYYYSIVLSIDNVYKPEFSVNANTSGDSAEITIDTEAPIVIKGKLIDICKTE